MPKKIKAMYIIFLRPKGEVLWADSNHIHDFPNQVIRGTESVPTDADLNRGERIVSAIRTHTFCTFSYLEK